MAKPFEGTVNVDIRDSEPDWTPFEPPIAPYGAPSVLYIVLDDVGFSALNGRNHTRNSMACITEAAIGFPNGSGTIPPENGMASEILVERGWNTYHVGKWHLCPEAEMNVASPRRNWPTGRGFERFYGFLGAETNQRYPDLVYDNHPVDQPLPPEEGYHLTEDITDKTLEFIKDSKVLAPDKPFFMYYVPGACHAPHHAPKAWIEKFRGRFDMGYEAIRAQTLARQKEMGIVPQNTELPPINPLGTMESHTDPDKPMNFLDTTKPWDSLGSVNENKLFNGIADDMAQNLGMLDELGGPKTYNHYPSGWAMAFNAPFKMWKRYEFNGGTADPCIFSWPGGMRARGEIRHQYHHAIDIVPTIVDALSIEPPETIKGYTQSRFDGVSMRYSFDDANAKTTRRTQLRCRHHPPGPGQRQRQAVRGPRARGRRHDVP